MTAYDLDDDQLATVHELLLRGLKNSELSRQQCEAYDAFCDAADIPLRIGDQPERVQAVWDEIFEEAGAQSNRTDTQP